ncbi:MAG: DNA gyrase C-terminal beta-propeller domain-containing protein, partial [Lachnospiraceae bacterium]
EIMIITNEGIIIRIAVNDINVLGRITSGVKLINMDTENDIRVASFTKVKEAEGAGTQEIFLEQLEKDMREEDEAVVESEEPEDESGDEPEAPEE